MEQAMGVAVVREPRFFCGIDWSSGLSDVAVIDRAGVVQTRGRFAATPDGVRELFRLLDGVRASHTHGRRQVPVAIESSQGLLVQALQDRGQPVYHLPPNQVAAARQQVQEPLPEGYDWTTATSIVFYVDGPKSFGARADVAQVLRESAQHPSDSYLFGRHGWMNAADVQRENAKSFLTICTPDPDR